MAPEDRLDSWKEIAGYLKRDVTTVQRWEKREGMPVRRHVHDKLGSVYAFADEELVVRSGLLFRNERHIRYSRIQNIETVQNPLHRAFGGGPPGRER